MALHIQQGFDLRHVKHYASANRAADAVQTYMKRFIDSGVVFNVLIVEQTDGDGKTRYVPLLNCWRCPANVPLSVAMMHAVHGGFTCFQ
jgi:hypothetical protein